MTSQTAIGPGRPSYKLPKAIVIERRASRSRHCERSEAIHEFQLPGLPRFARNDEPNNHRAGAALLQIRASHKNPVPLSIPLSLDTIPSPTTCALLRQVPARQQLPDVQFDGVTIGPGLCLGTGNRQTPMFTRN